MLLRMAWRNVWRNPRRTGVVVTAVAVGIGGTLFSIALFYGMAIQMVDTAIGTEIGHLQIHARGYDADPELQVRLVDGGRAAEAALAGRPEVRAYARRVRGDGLVTSSRSSAGVRIVGVEPQREARVSVVSDSITAGEWLGHTPRRVVMGERLAERLGVGLGDRVVLSATDLNGDLSGDALRIGGLFRTASSVVDRGTVFVSLDEAQTLLALGDAVSEVVVIAHDRDDVDGLRDALAAALPDSEVRTWAQMAPILLYLVEVFDQMGLIMYAAVFVAMAFGIANVLLMAVYERVREIGILMSIGMKRWRLAVSIVIESLLVTTVGVAIGFALAAACVAWLHDGIDLSSLAAGLEAYGVGTRIVPVMRRGDFVVPTAVAVGTAVLASAWPALRATRFRPAEAVRQV